MSRIKCKACDGIGAIGELINCPECNGLGWVEVDDDADATVSQWLDIKTTQPPMLESVLIATTSRRFPVRIAWRGKRFQEDTVGVWHAGPVGEARVAILEHQITHWMPLPAPPVLTDAPMMFDIWIEGYSAQGGLAGAQKIASDVVAGTFRDACIAFSKTKEAKVEGYGDFNEERLSFWGCALYDNEDDARKKFG